MSRCEAVTRWRSISEAEWVSEVEITKAYACGHRPSIAGIFGTMIVL